MRPTHISSFGIMIVAVLCVSGSVARAQTATLPARPSDTAIPADVVYPDAVTCEVNSPAGITYKVIFYKSQTVSFANEPNNVAEYGTTFIRAAASFDASTAYKWRLQLGRPGNITVLTLPSGWTSENCPIGKTVDNLRADKQALKIFTTQ
jgi:hypothetical protein